VKKVWQRLIGGVLRSTNFSEVRTGTGNGVEFTIRFPARSASSEYFLPVDHDSPAICIDVARMIAWRSSCTNAAAQGW
jgi:hypothetical protein